MNKTEEYYRDWEESTKTERTLSATLIDKAMGDLLDVFCPTCGNVLDPPSLEDILEWLKEEK